MTIPVCDWHTPWPSPLTVERRLPVIREPEPALHAERVTPTDPGLFGWALAAVPAIACLAGLAMGVGAVLVAAMAQPLFLLALALPAWIVWRGLRDARGM